LQLIVDDRASDAQRHAMGQVLLGKETVEAGTHWWVFSAMSDTIHDTLVQRIEYEVDLEARTASCKIDGVLESSAESILSPIDGSPHRVKIQIPHGIEFETAEIVNAKTKTTGAIKLDLKDTYGQLCFLHHTHEGPAYNKKSA
jgi:hypothetical protein